MDDSGAAVPDATYRFRLMVHQPGVSVIDRTVRLYTDTWLPGATFTAPASGATISGTTQQVVVTVPAASVNQVAGATLTVANGYLSGDYYLGDVDGNGDYVFEVDTTYATDGENEDRKSTRLNSSH